MVTYLTKLWFVEMFVHVGPIMHTPAPITWEFNFLVGYRISKGTELLVGAAKPYMPSDVWYEDVQGICTVPTDTDGQKVLDLHA